MASMSSVRNLFLSPVGMTNLPLRLESADILVITVEKLDEIRSVARSSVVDTLHPTIIKNEHAFDIGEDRSEIDLELNVKFI